MLQVPAVVLRVLKDQLVPAAAPLGPQVRQAQLAKLVLKVLPEKLVLPALLECLDRLAKQEPPAKQAQLVKQDQQDLLALQGKLE